jgi:hypothetical protein
MRALSIMILLLVGGGALMNSSAEEKSDANLNSDSVNASNSSNSTNSSGLPSQGMLIFCVQIAQYKILQAENRSYESELEGKDDAFKAQYVEKLMLKNIVLCLETINTDSFQNMLQTKNESEIVEFLVNKVQSRLPNISDTELTKYEQNLLAIIKNLWHKMENNQTATSKSPQENVKEAPSLFKRIREIYDIFGFWKLFCIGLVSMIVLYIFLRFILEPLAIAVENYIEKRKQKKKDDDKNKILKSLEKVQSDLMKIIEKQGQPKQEGRLRRIWNSIKTALNKAKQKVYTRKQKTQ